MYRRSIVGSNDTLWILRLLTDKTDRMDDRLNEFIISRI